jgi:hypothetical protein
MARKTDSARRSNARHGHDDAPSDGERTVRKLRMIEVKLRRTRENGREEQTGEGDEPDPRHWWKTAVAASFPT